ncbi:M48 family metallopeptidase [Labilibaculum sp. DW002]|uniref:M48 family metallopeptidase n=1 Tax=Paralabilibaculum antarcticum TaxID=2912572 RepID=A0ABT5VYM7_9BACT|nr:M48 family metallopeptidase [Labilibaculum sp. DW002]MDE5420451.1 M48 family metallopeptidase [Labilibaculum sp. DW002]
MKKNMRNILITGFLLFAAACATVPITGRKQMNLFPENQMIATSLTQYDTFLSESKLSANKEQSAMVKSCGARIAKAVEQFMNEHGMSDRIANFAWEFNLVEDATPNAWCMPGGKVVFYTGILPYTQTEAGLAVVMGHEIAHAIARHGNERMSQQMGIQALGTGLSVLVNEKPAETQQIWMTAFGAVSNVGVMLPFSRSHETEADKMGLIFMAMAGYDPAVAVDFWKRMGESGGQKPPEFLSTHPADDTRVQNLRAFLPEAMKYYKK